MVLDDDAGSRAVTDEGAVADIARVLLADDDDGVRRMIARALTRHGLEVLQACDGVQALEIADRHRPDFAIVDLRMPQKSGLEVVRELKAKHGIDMPVLVLSGLDEPEDRVGAFDAGADDFISKPVYVKEFLKRIDAFERHRRALIELKEANARADRLRLFGAEAAALLAHDLNNGLSIASANLQYLEEVLPIEGEPGEALSATIRALRRMTGLVRNFVDISRLEDAAINPQRGAVDVRELLTTAAMIHDPRRSPGDRGIVVECEERLAAHIDPVLVERVIHNLLNNATRYVQPGGQIGMRAKIEQSPDDEDRLYIGVGNTGSPIPESLRPTLFAKYRKGGDGKAQRGMGLYFCHLACQAHGGSIQLEGDDLYPTYFVIRLGLS